MSYHRTPPDFMKDIFIAPHSFSDPEHPEHGQYVNLQMKNDLYNETLYKITGCEFSLFGSRDEELSVERIRKCEGSDPLNGVAARIFNKKNSQSQMISCQDWTVVKKVGPSLVKSSQSVYRVKIYQTKTDVFYSQVHPPTPWKLFKSYTFN